YVDVYLVHWPGSFFNTPDKSAQLGELMQALRESGKAKTVGLSNFEVGDLNLLGDDLSNFVVNQIPYSLLEREYEGESLQACQKSGVATMAYSLEGRSPFMDHKLVEFAFRMPTEYKIHGWQKKRIFLANELLAEFIEVHGDDFSGVGGGERHFLSFVPHGPECGEKERFPGDHSFSGVEKLAEESLVLAGIAKNGLHFDSLGHVHHRPRLGDHHLIRIERDFDKLHVIAEQLVVDLVCAACGRRSRRLDGLLRPDA
ncbi:MAG: aldo/keto reductase, partial [Planctomycetes bacterium]|nr:aldo/keto reductase [Planctomycetota bacterium]